ncbi:hypothetical protein V8F20_002846 [Naviculisporaceae sp. PSN 640]
MSQEANNPASLSLSTLPNEMLMQIIEAIESPESYLEHQYRDAESVRTLQNLRLTSRKFSELTGRCLIPSYRLSCDFASVGRLISILRHPTIGTGLVVLRVSLDSYSPLLATDYTMFLLHAIARLSVMIECKWPWRRFPRPLTWQRALEASEFEEALAVRYQWERVFQCHQSEQGIPVEFREVAQRLEDAYNMYCKMYRVSETIRYIMARLAMHAMQRNPRLKTLHFTETCLSTKPWHIYPDDPLETYYNHLSSPFLSRLTVHSTVRVDFTDYWPGAGYPYNYELLHEIPRALQQAKERWGISLTLDNLIVKVYGFTRLASSQRRGVTTALRDLRLKRFIYRVDDNVRCMFTMPEGYLTYLCACLSPEIFTLQEIDLGVTPTHHSYIGPFIGYESYQAMVHDFRRGRYVPFLEAFAIGAGSSTSAPTASPLGHRMWQNLKTIRLQKAYFVMADLLKFLRNTPESLNTLILDRPGFWTNGRAWFQAPLPGEEHHPSWERILDKIRASKTFNGAGQGSQLGFRLRYTPTVPLVAYPGDPTNLPDERQRVFGDLLPRKFTRWEPFSAVCEEDYGGTMNEAEEYVNRCGKSADVNPVRVVRERLEAQEAQNIESEETDSEGIPELISHP